MLINSNTQLIEVIFNSKYKSRSQMLFRQLIRNASEGCWKWNDLDAQIIKLLKSSKTPYFLAPMFQINDLDFREVCRKHRILLCWTGMINSHIWIINPKNQKNVFDTCPSDRPLIDQLNGVVYVRACFWNEYQNHDFKATIDDIQIT